MREPNEPAMPAPVGMWIVVDHGRFEGRYRVIAFNADGVPMVLNHNRISLVGNVFDAGTYRLVDEREIR